MGTIKQGKLHIGEKHINKQGCEFEIIDWKKSTDVTVKFSDGTIKENCEYGSITKGTCPYPNYKLHIGEKHVNKQGLEFEIVDYIDAHNITVRFPDGTVRKKCDYSSIKEGSCPHPTIKPHIGEKHINNQGYEFEIIDYIDCYNVTVKFSDGTIKKGCKYGGIKNGKCPNPSIKPHIGEKFVNKQGEKFEIIDYIDTKNITVKFYDGVIKGKCNYSSIRKGQCPHLNVLKKNYIGEKLTNKQGIEFEIIDYIDSRNVTVKFSDGAIKKAGSYGNIKEGWCPHPTFIYYKSSEFAGFITESRAFQKNGNSYYPCICQKCNYKDILNPQEMVEHRDKCKG